MTADEPYYRRRVTPSESCEYFMSPSPPTTIVHASPSAHDKGRGNHLCLKFTAAPLLPEEAHPDVCLRSPGGEEPVTACRRRREAATEDDRELLAEVHPCRAGAPPCLFMATAGASTFACIVLLCRDRGKREGETEKLLNDKQFLCICTYYNRKIRNSSRRNLLWRHGKSFRGLATLPTAVCGAPVAGSRWTAMAAMASGSRSAVTASGSRSTATASGSRSTATASGSRSAATASGRTGLLSSLEVFIIFPLPLWPSLLSSITIFPLPLSPLLLPSSPTAFGLTIFAGKQL
nr:hypothetical protein Iba_chr12dCG14320 [Ipomoea batatas]